MVLDLVKLQKMILLNIMVKKVCILMQLIHFYKNRYTCRKNYQRQQHIDALISEVSLYRAYNDAVSNDPKHSK